jgi:preprotein translocase subunit SecD
MKSTLLLILGLAVTGCALFGGGKHTTLRIHEEVETEMPKYAMPVELPGYNLKLTVDSRSALSEKNVKAAALYPTAGGAGILLRFDRHGMILLDELTTRLRGRRLVTVLNGRPVAVWLVNQRLTNGQFLVQGDFTDDEAKQAVADLNALGRKKD